jgi:hypothetical protein
VNRTFDPAGLATRSHSEYVQGKSLLDMVREDLIAERIAVESYNEITGNIRVSPSPVKDKCQVPRNALATANEVLETLDSQLADLSFQVKFATPEMKIELQQEIGRLKSQPPGLVKRVDAPRGPCRDAIFRILVDSDSLYSTAIERTGPAWIYYSPPRVAARAGFVDLNGFPPGPLREEQRRQFKTGTR